MQERGDRPPSESAAPGDDARLSQIHQTEIDGVPTFWIDDDGPIVACLMFRTGQWDEPATAHGITHLVEHLAMSTLGQVPYSANATVDGTTTKFFVRGSAQEVSGFLRSVCLALGRLPLDRIHLESRILRTEASTHDAGVVGRLLWLRYGYVGPGLTWLRELGLNNPRAAEVQAWATARLSRGNCVLWFTGRIPDDVTMSLPDGPRIPLQDFPPIANLKVPVALQSGQGGVAIGLESRRTSAATTILRIALLRLHERIRMAQGLTYEVGYSRDYVTTSRAHDAMWLTCLDEQAAPVRTEMLRVFSELAATGPTEEELADDLRAFVRHGSDPDLKAHDVAGAALYELMGMPPLGYAGLLEERRAVTAEQCAFELREMLPTAILLTPPGSGMPAAPFGPYPVHSARIVDGRAFRPAKQRFPWEKGDRLIVGADGISQVGPDGQGSTVLWRDCVALLSETDGGRVLVGSDGFTVRLTPGNWRDGEQARRLVDAAVPVDLRVAPPS